MCVQSSNFKKSDCFTINEDEDNVTIFLHTFIFFVLKPQFADNISFALDGYVKFLKAKLARNITKLKNVTKRTKQQTAIK